MKNKPAQYSIVSSNKFKRQLKIQIKRGKSINKIKEVIDTLSIGNNLDSQYRDHSLRDDKIFYNCRECHIEPDWLLVYKYSYNILYLVATG